MSPRLCLTLITVAAMAVGSVLTSQQQKTGFERVSFRVFARKDQGQVVVDRGRRDRVMVGDRVFFRPRGGRVYRGTVSRVDERNATVELVDRKFLPPLGTRGEVMVPRKRFPPARKPDTGKQGPTKKTPPTDPPRTPDPKKKPPAHPPWQNKDKGYQKGQPLLSGVRAVRPRERQPRLTGRMWTAMEFTQDAEGGHDNSFVRAGTDILWQNPFRRGGELRFDGEVDYLTERDDERTADLTVRELSYSWGSDRFSNTRWEVGRFYQHGVPELGMLDGVEWTRREKNGHRWGVSFGFLPELDDDMESFRDLQIAGYYLWTPTLSERFTIGGAFQKTMHAGTFDRDLLIGKVRYMPENGWDLHATMWVDLYDARADTKPFFEVTRLSASAGRRWADSGVDFSYVHNRYPELERNDFWPRINDNELDDNQLNRLTSTSFVGITERMRLNGRVALWDDQDGNGASAETGVDIEDLWWDDSRADVRVFGSLAEFETLIGVRFAYGRNTDNGRWDTLYEIGQHHQRGFPNDRDDILQHRLRASRTFYLDSGWDISAHAEAVIWDDDWSWTLGVYMHKSF